MPKTEYVPQVAAIPDSSDIALTRRSGLTTSGDPSVMLSDLQNQDGNLRGDMLLTGGGGLVIGGAGIEAVRNIPNVLSTHDIFNGSLDVAVILFALGIVPYTVKGLVSDFRRVSDMRKEQSAIRTFVAKRK